MSNYDVGIIGAGVAGAFATLKIAKDYKNVKAVVFDIGRPPMKRRRQLEGWLGCLPNSDGKLYSNNINKISEVIGSKKTSNAYNWFQNVLSNVNDSKEVKDKKPKASVIKSLNNMGYELELNNYTQLYPKDIHALSKYMSDIIENAGNIKFQFDNEVKTIYKKKNSFIIISDGEEIICKKIIIAVGRSGWRWSRTLFDNFGIIESNDIAKFGIRVEMNAAGLKDFNKSNCSISKEGIEIGPFSWFGSIVPEDHVDMAISAFRGNEKRWETEKVSFPIIGSRCFPGSGVEQTDRLAKLTFLLSNDRIVKERISLLLNNKSKISIMKEYSWLKEPILELASIIPDFTKANFHIPTIMPLAPKVNINNCLETDIKDMYIVGETANLNGILSAALTGISAATDACK